MRRKFTLEYWTDEGWYVGRLKEIPGVFSQGEKREELSFTFQPRRLEKLMGRGEKRKGAGHPTRPLLLSSHP